MYELYSSYIIILPNLKIEMQSNNPLKNSEILFHNTENQLYHTKQSPDEKFGILRLKMAPAPIMESECNSREQKIAMIFTIDTSSSMTDYCSDNRRKLDHAVQTLIGIMRYLADDTKCPHNTEVNVAILSFSSEVKHILDFTPITQENLQHIIDLIYKIYAQDSTNIEVALKEANRMLIEYSNDHPDTVLYHIQLTDGEVTDGEKDHSKLAQMVNPTYTNIFVGFGKYHDDYLLCRLSENPRNDYRFIDKLEFSSIVYGEILYNILYHCYDTIDIDVHDAEIYNWRTNQWSRTLRVHNLPYDCERVFHLRTDANTVVYNIEAKLTTKTKETEETETVCCYPELLDMENETMEVRDLTNYSFRQKTQELLYEVREFVQKQKEAEEEAERSCRNSTSSDYLSGGFEPQPLTQLDIFDQPQIKYSNDTKRELYDKCSEFMRTMKEYMITTNLTEDRFMRLLQDDIYIVLKTLYRRNAHLWCATRHNSLGREHSYQPSHGIDVFEGSLLDTDIDMDMNCTITTPRPKMKRNRPRVFYTTQDPPIYTFPLFEHPLDTPDITGDIGNHEMSQNFDTTMMSPTMARTVNAISESAVTTNL